MIKKKDTHDQKRKETTQHRKHPEHLSWSQKHDPHENQT